jgi:hypothetical protein
MSITKIKQLIKNNAWQNFPAQELWIRENDLTFWAFEKTKESVIVTDGMYTNDKGLTFTTTSHPSQEIETFVDNLIVKKLNEGYTCFASELFV